jgi:soluble lytic murein transglycosylase
MMQRATLERRRRRRRRGRGAGVLAAGLLTLVLAFAAIYYIAFFPEQIEKQVYPLLYTDLITQYAGEYGLDPARVCAVIYCESSFRADAVSSADARGLMQIMPSTGGWIASKLNEEPFDVERLFDPETNIRYGCWYLNYLDNRAGGDLTKATASYHAGPGKVAEWLSDDANSKDGVALDVIPSSVTNAYVQNVRQMYEKYKEIIAS